MRDLHTWFGFRSGMRCGGVTIIQQRFQALWRCIVTAAIAAFLAGSASGDTLAAEAAATAREASASSDIDVDARGEWFELRDRYTRADREYTVSLSWSSGSGLRVTFSGGGVFVEDVIGPSAVAQRIPGTHQLRFDARDIPEGAHAFEVFAQTTTGEGQSEPWTVLVDRTPPGQASQFSGVVDEALNVVIDWDSAVDPNLPDGSLGSGTAGYSVRYRIGTGPWTAPVDTPFPTLRFSGAAAGQSVDVEVTARDQVGNVGTPVTASMVLARGDADPCAAPSPPPECQDPPPGTPVDAESDPDIDLDAGEGPARSDDEQLDTNANLRHLRAKSDVCRTNRCWATIRSAPQSWAIGMVRIEPPAGADEDLRVTSTLAETGNDSHWYFGGLSRLNGRCRWVSGTAIGRATPTTSDCRAGGERYPFQGFQSKPYGGVRGNNCFLSDGRWLPIGQGTCDRGTRITLRSATVECADVGLQVDGDTRDSCTGENVIRDRVPAGTCVEWRYVTRDRNWVLVRDRQRPIERGGWVFIPEHALAPDRDDWTSYGAGQCV